MLRASETVWRTDTGRQRRDNEDNAFARAPVFVVADGMGGAQAGEVASKIAIEAFEQGLPDGGSAEERLADRVKEANRRIYEQARAEHGRAGMGTTLTAAYLQDACLVIAHVGDSRAYMFRDGSLQRLTQDHSLVDELVRRGKLTEEQAAEHPQRSIITRALGPEPSVEVDTWRYPVRAGDVLLLCSDGLTSMVPEERVTEILAPSQSLELAADQLIDEANQAGGRDNITVVLFRLEEVATAEGDDQATVVNAPTAQSPDGSDRPAVAVVPRPRTAPAPGPEPTREPAPAPPRSRRRVKALAALAAAVIVLGLILGGGYLATRQLYFVGTNSQGVVTIYRGLPYDLPVGLHLYETFYVSGVPASLVPADRRTQVFDNRLRSQSDAQNLVHDLELGRVSK
jgi:serine/threonine protein phosphatase PrpC